MTQPHFLLTGSVPIDGTSTVPSARTLDTDTTLAADSDDKVPSQKAIKAFIATYAQPLDSDLTAIAALSTTAFGRGFLDLADAAAGRTKLALGTAATETLSTLNGSGTHAARPAAGTAGRTYFETDTGVLYRDSGSAWVAASTGRVAKTAAQTLTQSNTTLQNLTSLVFPVEASEVWFVEAWLLLTDANTTADWKFGWTAPAGATAAWGMLSSVNVAGSLLTAGLAQTPLVTLSLADVAQEGGGGVTHPTMLAGWFTMGANAGNVQLQAAQNTSNASNNTIEAGSFLRLTRLV